MPTTTKLTFSEFADLLLAGLHDAEDADEGGGLTDLNAIARPLQQPVPRDWVVDAAKVLQARGLAQCKITFGACFAKLTGEGRMYVEQQKGTGIISRYQHDKQQFVQHVTINGGTVGNLAVGDLTNVAQVTGDERGREPVFDAIRDVELRLKSDPSLDAGDRDDALADVDSLRRQLRKREPDRNVLAALLDSLGRVASVGVQVLTLIKMING